METGYEVVNGDFVKDEEVIAVPTKIEEFMVIRNLIKEAYLRASQNKHIHSLEINPTLEKVREIYEGTFNYLLEQEGGRIYE